MQQRHPMYMRFAWNENKRIQGLLEIFRRQGLSVQAHKQVEHLIERIEVTLTSERRYM